TVLGMLRANIPVLYASLICFLGGAAVMSIRPGAFGGPGPFGAASHTWLAGLYGAFILLAVVDQNTLVARVLRTRVLVWFGLTSYGIYVYHMIVNGVIHGLLGTGVRSVDTPAGIGLSILALA